MINFGRIFRFLRNFLSFFTIFIIVIFILSFVTEIIAQEGGLAERVLRLELWLLTVLNLLPALAVMAFTLYLAGVFLHRVYDLESWREGVGFLLRSRFGPLSFSPWVKVSEGQVTGAKTPVLSRAGGPGNLVVYNDSAVVLEKRGRLTRVEGKGFPSLDAFEKIYDVVDLRPKRYVYTVSAMSREGILVKWDVEVRYQIEGGGKLPTPDEPFPFSEEAVLRAATCKWRREPNFQYGQDMDWEGLIVVSQTEGLLRTILARRPLNELIGVTQSAAHAAREAVQDELKAGLEEVVTRFGAKLIDVKLDNLQVDDKITEQWIKNWKTGWQRWSAGRLAYGEATYLYEYETVKAEAQMQMIVKLTQAFQKQLMQQTISPNALSQMVLTRLFSVLDRADFASSSRIFFPTQTLAALEGIRKALSPAKDSAVSSVILDADSLVVRINDNTCLKAIVRDAQGHPAPDGTEVQFSVAPSHQGRISPDVTFTIQGKAQADFFSGASPGPVEVEATSRHVSGRLLITITSP